MRRSLRQQIIIILLLAMVPAFVLFAAVALVAGSSIIQDQNNRLSHTVMTFLHQEIDDFHLQAEQAFISVAAAATAREIERPQDMAFMQALIQSYLSAYPQFQTIQITDQEGIVRLVIPRNEQRLGDDDSNQAYVNMVGIGEYWSPASISAYDGQAKVSLSRRWPGGVITGFLSLGELQTSLQTINRQLRGSITITDAFHTIIADSDPGKVARRERFEPPGRPTVLADGSWSQTAVLAKGEEVLLIGQHIARSGWNIIISLPADEVQAPLRIFGVICVGLLLVSVGTGLALALLWTRSLLSHIHDLAEAARHIGEGQNEVVVPIPPQPVELRLFASTLAEMQRGILERQAAISSLNQDLEARVEYRTAQLEASNHELKTTLEHLQTAQEQIVRSERLAAIGGLVAGVAHEVNTPIGVALTASSYLEEQIQACVGTLESGQIARKYLDEFLKQSANSSQIICRSLERAADLVRSLKLVAVDHAHVDLRVFKLGEYLHEVLKTVHPALRHRPITIEIVVEPEIELTAAPGVFAQIVTNLIMNSLIHAYAPDQSGTIRIEAKAEDRNLVIAYRDDGAGIAPDVLPRVFEPFFTTKRQEGGTGLGLHIVNNIVRNQLGGSIILNSQLGQGVLFVITLPGLLKK